MEENDRLIERTIKRIIDFTVSISALALFSPLLIIIYAFIKRESPGAGLFIQERIGKDGNAFKMYKFRTMKSYSEEETLGKYIYDFEQHMTKSGRLLRRWALDEVPQLFNVIMGTMSIVGPRPTLKYQVDKYNERQQLRLRVKPGLTGWAQINGRNSLTWPERIELDIWYVENWSLWLDMKIILKTPFVLLRGEGAFSSKDLDDEIVKTQGE